MPDTPEVRALRLGANLPQGTFVYVALSVGSLLTAGVELTLTGYARVAVDDWTTSVPGVGESERANTLKIQFPTITSLGTTDHWAIYDSAVAGVLLNAGEILDNLSQPVTIVISPGDDLQFPAGALLIKDQQV